VTSELPDINVQGNRVISNPCDAILCDGLSHRICPMYLALLGYFSKASTENCSSFVSSVKHFLILVCSSNYQAIKQQHETQLVYIHVCVCVCIFVLNIFF
jgi:hypothetical protein